MLGHFEIKNAELPSAIEIFRGGERQAAVARNHRNREMLIL
jgi:hypothetical protein